MTMPVEVQTVAAASTTLVVLVENKSGVLARVADLFARRGFNIESLAVAPTSGGMSRITIVVGGDKCPMDQITSQLFKLINVVEIAQVEPADAIQRELLIATIVVAPSDRSQVVELVNLFDGKVVAVGSDFLTVSMEAGPLTVNNFEALLADYQIVDMQRSGLVALPKMGTEVRRLRAI